MRLRLKTFVAIAATASLLVLSGSPASADTNNSMLATSLGGPGPCGAFTGGIVLKILSGGPSTWTTEVVSANMVTSFTQGGGNYIVETTRHTAGAHNGAIIAGNFLIQNVVFRIDIYNATGAPTCAKGTRLCTLQAPYLGATGPLSALPDAAGDLPLNATVTLNGSATLGLIFPNPCNAPFSSLVGTPSTVLPLSLIA